MTGVGAVTGVGTITDVGRITGVGTLTGAGDGHVFRGPRAGAPSPLWLAALDRPCDPCGAPRGAPCQDLGPWQRVCPQRATGR